VRDVRRRTAQLTALYDYAGRAGGKHVRARLARRRSERWIASVVSDVRSGRLAVDENAALDRIAHHTELDGLALPERTAAVELLNVLRPTIAVSVYIVFVAHALHRHPHIAAALSTEDNAYESAFVQEVRRFYPFFPAVPARVRDSFRWDGYEFPARTRVVFDLHGTNHDARVWDAPAHVELAGASCRAVYNARYSRTNGRKELETLLVRADARGARSVDDGRARGAVRARANRHP
jgi:fatty-acid peroxygenase